MSSAAVERVPHHKSSLALPDIIQGGMGIYVSNQRIARAVGKEGGLGVVSGTAIDTVYARLLQDKNPGARLAIQQFPDKAIADEILEKYWGKKRADGGYKAIEKWTLRPSEDLQKLAVVSAFAEVRRAKHGHEGIIGMNLLKKVELPLPYTILGAMIAGVDVVTMGAGNPAEIPQLLRDLSEKKTIAMSIVVDTLPDADRKYAITLDPKQFVPDNMELKKPTFLAIVASNDLAEGLAMNPRTRPDGFIIEGHSAGGHNASPRGAGRFDKETKKLIPQYGPKDEVDLERFKELGLPFWLAGSWATPEKLHDALALGAEGIQAGTVFAFTRESGFSSAIKDEVLNRAKEGTLVVRKDFRASPTGFPFNVAEVEGTLTDTAAAADHERKCDVGYLTTIYEYEHTKRDGEKEIKLGYRCPADKEEIFLHGIPKQGKEHDRMVAQMEGRQCLCNALLSAADLPQKRRQGFEPPLVTTGEDLSGVAHFAHQMQPGQEYTVRQVMQYLRSYGTT